MTDTRTPDLLYRELILDRSLSQDDDGTVTMSVSSEAPYLRKDSKGLYWEVLSHRDGAIDTTRLNDGAAVLWNHNPDEQVGVVERFWTDNGKGYAKVRFSNNSQKGKEVGGDVRDGIIRNVSIGYMVREFDNPKTRAKDADGIEVRTVTNYEIYEVSMVSIPADTTVGVGKAFVPAPNISETAEEKAYAVTTESTVTQSSTSTSTYNDDGSTVYTDKVTTESESVTTVNPNAADSSAEAQEEADEAQTDNSDATTENEENAGKSLFINETVQPVGATTRSTSHTAPTSGHMEKHTMSDAMKDFAELREFAKLTGQSEAKALEWLDAGRSLRDVKDEYMAKQDASRPDLSKRELQDVQTRGFDLMIKGFSKNRRPEGPLQELGIEANRSAGIVTRDGAMAIPVNVPFVRANRAMITSDSNGGQSFVTAQYISVEQALREQTQMGRLGVTQIIGATSEIKLPRITTGSVPTNLTNETGSASSTGLTTEILTWSPNEILAYVPFSKTLGLLNQDYSVREIIQGDAVTAVLNHADKMVIAGTGANGQWTGIVNDGAIPLSLSGSSYSFTYARAQNLWKTVRSFNGLGEGVYLVTPDSYATGEATGSFAGSTLPMINGGRINNRPVFDSNYLVDQPVAGRRPILYGDFSSVLFVQFGALTIWFDDLSSARNNTDQLTVAIYADSKARQPLNLARDVFCNG